MSSIEEQIEEMKSKIDAIETKLAASNKILENKKQSLTQEQSFMIADLKACINMFVESIMLNDIPGYIQMSARSKEIMNKLILSQAEKRNEHNNQ